MSAPPDGRCHSTVVLQPDPAWTVCGLPEVLYSDHGSDFKRRHLEQVAADLRIQLINSTVGVPQGRGKIERLFGTITTELLPQLAGWLPPAGAGPRSSPRDGSTESVGCAKADTVDPGSE